MEFVAGLVATAGAPLLLAANLYLRFRAVSSTSDFEPAGKVVVITGASSGIGADVAREYARAGAMLVLAARRPAELDAVAQECRHAGARDVVCVAADVSVDADCLKLVRTAHTLGDIDCLVLNAGISMSCRLDELESTADIRRIMEVNYFGCSATTYYALESLLRTAPRGGGRILVVSSVLGVVSGPTRTAYSASKHALDGFFNGLRLENPELTITMAYPGFVATDLDRTRIKGKPGKGLDLSQPAVNGNPVMKSDVCARILVDAVRNKERHVDFGFKYCLARLLRDWYPYVIDFQSMRTMRRRHVAVAGKQE